MYENNNKEVGIITEQGFVAGQGLGYTPTSLGNKDDTKNPNEKKQST